ncbi:sensor histidine kinase [Zobellella maritima]|uniref:sensor histidine kinase n=1 Tax=Zobellella maritima TaxID=2059725 RepID=UPI001E5AE563|nr:ATP-binding protein [Zobellella maritima]
MLLFALVLVGIWRSSWQRLATEQELQAQQQLLLYRTTLEAEIARFENIPRVLQSHPVLLAALAKPEDPDRITQANLLLERIGRETGAETLYLMDAGGFALATGNWNTPTSFIGQNYRYRPYFKDALQGSFGEFYGVGATTGVPGYFFGLPLGSPNSPSGVLAVKISLLALEHSWQPSRELLMVVDSDQVVALASRPELKFKTLAPLTTEARERLATTRQYVPMRLEPLELGIEGRQRQWQGHRYLVSELPLARLGWRLQLWWPSAPLYAHANLVTATLGFSLVTLLSLLLYWRQRRRYIRVQLKAKGELEHKVMERTAALAASNRQLEWQVQERIQAEARLRSMQHELIQSNRLAALGQMAASVAHEVNQPLTALKNQSANTLMLARRAMYPQVEESLQTMGRLVDRMARLTSQLKLFAATRRTTAGRARPQHALNNVLSWLQPKLDEQGVELHHRLDPELNLPMELHALEQVLANLIGNSLDALAGKDGGLIGLEAGPQRLTLWDNGPGIDAALIDKVTEPFFSTKQLGQGLGLGLAIARDLVEASDARLVIRQHEGGGVEFIIGWTDEQHRD